LDWLTPRWLVIAAALSTVACDRVRTARECHAIAAVVNPALAALEASQQGGDAALGDLANRYDQLALDLADLRPDSPELAAAVADHLALYRQTARLLRQLHAARRQRDGVAAARLRVEIGNEVRREKALVRRIAQICETS
jgi:hypothetical protein